KDTTADLIVMPRCRSSARVSVWVLPSLTLPTWSMTPAAYRSRSVSVVLPASTCARIPRLRVLTKRHVLWIGENLPRRRHERCSHCRSLADRMLRRVQQTALGRATHLARPGRLSRGG